MRSSNLLGFLNLSVISAIKSNIDVFIAYAREDKEYLNKLRVYLKPLSRNKTIRIWYDGEIVPGTVWEKDIKSNLHKADIILLLVSAFSLDSDYFYDKEMADALERHHKEETIVVPVILSDCMWDKTPLRDLQFLPRDAKPLNSWDNESSAYTNVVRGLDDSIEEVENRRANLLNEQKEAEAKKREEERLIKEKADEEKRIRQEKLDEAKAKEEQRLKEIQDSKRIEEARLEKEKVQAEIRKAEEKLAEVKATEQRLKEEQEAIRNESVKPSVNTESVTMSQEKQEQLSAKTNLWMTLVLSLGVSFLAGVLLSLIRNRIWLGEIERFPLQPFILPGAYLLLLAVGIISVTRKARMRYWTKVVTISGVIIILYVIFTVIRNAILRHTEFYFLYEFFTFLDWSVISVFILITSNSLSKKVIEKFKRCIVSGIIVGVIWATIRVGVTSFDHWFGMFIEGVVLGALIGFIMFTENVIILSLLTFY